MNIRIAEITSFPMLMALSACALDAIDREDRQETAFIEQEERWSAYDDPSLFSPDLEQRLEKLPDQGETSVAPWPGNYWPTAQDSINFRWDGPRTQSPAKKYELAFGRAGVEDRVSRFHGIDSQPAARRCTRDAQCNATLGEVCAKRHGNSWGRCIPTWFGLCHAWAPAAILLPEPKREVVRNGVTFKVQDIKALATLVHDRTQAKTLSLRCEHNDESGEIRYDEHGRPTEECRDTNAGTFHVVLANYLGIQKESFIEDRTFDYQVWSYPVRSYKVIEKRTVTAQQANQLLGVTAGGATPDNYAFNPDATAFVYVESVIGYVAGAHPAADGSLTGMINHYTGRDRYEYILELDGSGRIIGGEWVGSSKRNHPDFLWLPLGPGASGAAGGAIRYEDVMSLVDASQ